MNVVAVIRLTPGTVIRRLTTSEPSACAAIARSRIAISPPDPRWKRSWKHPPGGGEKSSPRAEHAPRPSPSGHLPVLDALDDHPRDAVPDHDLRALRHQIREARVRCARAAYRLPRGRNSPA